MPRMNPRPLTLKPLAISLVLCFVLVLFTSPISSGQRRTQTTSTPTGLRDKRPRLVLLKFVDQFRYDYLERFGDLFGPNGLRRLMRDGASWVQSNYDHMPTYTAPGHATMMTGAWPAETGIVGNEWPDRTTGKRVTSVSDDSVRPLGGNPNEPASSPRRLMASTVGDELRLATNDRSKVIGVSVKDRSGNPARRSSCERRLLVQHGSRQHGLIDLLLRSVACLGDQIQQHAPGGQVFRRQMGALAE
jgi:hypothetical protein